jgi:peptidoglycan hydrolase CwlO-like protein
MQWGSKMQGETATNLDQKCNELKEQLNEAKTALHEKDRRLDGVKAECDQLRDKISIMDERLVARDKCGTQ